MFIFSGVQDQQTKSKDSGERLKSQKRQVSQIPKDRLETGQINLKFEDENLSDEEKLQRIEINSEIIHYNTGLSDFIGYHETRVAFKNENSFMVTTLRKGLIVVEDGNLVSKCTLPKNYRINLLPIYSRHLDCYFLFFQSKIYKKRIDGSGLELYMDPDPVIVSLCSYSFEYSEKLQRLMMKYSDDKISFINLATKKVDYRLNLGTNGLTKIAEFSLLKPQENQMLILTRDGTYMIYGLFGFGASRRRVLCHKVTQYNIGWNQNLQIFPGYSEKQQQFALVSISRQLRHLCHSTEVLIAKISKGEIESFIEPPGKAFQGSKEKWLDLKFCACFGKYLIFLGMIEGIIGNMTLVVYDTETNELNELKGKRVNHLLRRPLGFHRVGNVFCAVGSGGAIQKFTLDFKKN